MAALGDSEAAGLLKEDLQNWRYGPRLLALRDYADTYLTHSPSPQSVYDLWLGVLTVLHSDMSGEKNFPKVMRTRAWRLKQLNTQLASWAELRHDAILYAKQPHTRQEECSYPAGYVEPYPDFYGRIGKIAKQLADSLANLEQLAAKEFPPAEAGAIVTTISAPRGFWERFSATMVKLERLASKELAGEPFTADEDRFLKDTVEMHQGDCSEPTYSGWYCSLTYPNPSKTMAFSPTVADVHTDPNRGKVLQVGVGRANLAIVAIDNGAERMAFIGPIYSYYEFERPITDRLTDEAFSASLDLGTIGGRPKWTGVYEPAGGPYWLEITEPGAGTKRVRVDN